MALKHISPLWSAKGVIMGHGFFFCPGQKPISPGHVGDTAFFAQDKKHTATFGALGGLALTPHTISNGQTCQKDMYDK